MNIIKESFDNLPMALCFFNSRGIACLVNRRMLWVSTQLLGSSVQTFRNWSRHFDPHQIPWPSWTPGRPPIGSRMARSCGLRRRSYRQKMAAVTPR